MQQSIIMRNLIILKSVNSITIATAKLPRWWIPSPSSSPHHIIIHSSLNWKRWWWGFFETKGPRKKPVLYWLVRMGSSWLWLHDREKIFRQGKCKVKKCDNVSFSQYSSKYSGILFRYFIFCLKKEGWYFFPYNVWWEI